MSAAIDAVKHVREADKQFTEAELKAQMAEIYSALADAKMALADAQQELRSKDDEITRIHQSFLLFEETVESGGYLYRKGSRGQPVGLPYCPICMEESGSMRLTVKIDIEGIVCPACKSVFGSSPADYAEE